MHDVIGPEIAEGWEGVENEMVAFAFIVEIHPPEIRVAVTV